MEQQGQLSAAAQQQRQQSATDTATSLQSANEEAFDSVRQAAVVMFKQRTRDLTRLAQVEEQCQTIETELHQAQTCVAQLAAQQASLEALVEEEQQSTRQRENRLQELHSTLLQLDEEQKMSGRLQQAAEAAITAAATFIQNFTDADGRLFQLLSTASARTGGRSARELQRLLTEVQQGLLTAEAHRSSFACLPSFSICAEAPESGELHYTEPPPTTSVASADDTTTSVLRTLQEWMAKTHWAQHGELASVLKITQQLVAWFSMKRGTREEAGKTAAAGETSCGQDSLWPPPTPSATDAMTEHHWLRLLAFLPADIKAEAHHGGTAGISTEDDTLFGALQSKDRSMDAAGDSSPESEAVQLAVQQNLLAPLQAILTSNAHLVALCEEEHVQLPEDAPSLPASVNAAQREWESFYAAWLQWREDVLKAKSAVKAAMVAEADLDVAQATLYTLQQRCEEQSHNHASRVAEVGSLKETEINHHAAAWSRGLGTVQAQRDSIGAMSETLASLTDEEAALTTAAHNGSESHAHELHAHDIALTKQREELTAARQRAEVAEAKTTSLEAEYSDAQRVQQLVQAQHEALLSCASRCLQSPLSATIKGDDGAEISQAASRSLGEMPVARCAATAAQTLLQSITAHSPSRASWTERLVEMASEVDVAAGEDHNGGPLTDSVSQFFANLIVSCGGGEAAGGESCDEPPLDAAAVRSAIQGAAAGLRLPSDLFLDDVVDAQLLAEMPYLRTLGRAEQARRARIEEHRLFMCDATTEIALLRSELATANE
ncbi:hypothetical protein JKF63_01539 [Porcisia hertigi]|uniref:Uncharacterized protein n=1 Tax=Porcisia hertigi TaxID=2761500 RepID=A0A836HHU6_9TRYP|nr:hypothetical protein JKF63_01539 [Porcisia hertigi]